MYKRQVYTGANPLDDWDTADQEALLEALDFNPRASAVYEAVDGTVIQEGSDTLRIQKNGKITFHAAESGQARFQALSAREKDLQIKAEEILDGVTAGHLGEGTMFCLSLIHISLRALRPRETKKKGKISDSFENLGGKLQK